MLVWTPLFRVFRNWISALPAQCGTAPRRPISRIHSAQKHPAGIPWKARCKSRISGVACLYPSTPQQLLGAFHSFPIIWAACLFGPDVPVSWSVVVEGSRRSGAQTRRPRSTSTKSSAPRRRGILSLKSLFSLPEDRRGFAGSFTSHGYPQRR
jgi:hypothetical protein